MARRRAVTRRDIACVPFLGVALRRRRPLPARDVYISRRMRALHFWAVPACCRGPAPPTPALPPRSEGPTHLASGIRLFTSSFRICLPNFY